MVLSEAEEIKSWRCPIPQSNNVIKSPDLSSVRCYAFSGRQPEQT
jgi:hypothetical protein